MTERYLGAGGLKSRVAVVEAEPETETQDTAATPAPVNESHRIELAEPAGTEASPAEVGGGEAVDPLYPVALLKIAMAMRRLPAAETRVFEALLDDVLSDMVIDRDDFKSYLERNMGRLVAAVKMRGY